MTTAVVIGLSAVIVAMRDGEASVLTVRPHDSVTDRASTLEGLPFGPFDPDGHRTFELALKEFVGKQTGYSLGYVEQLYTFGDKGRDAPLADVGAGAARVISVGYLALAPAATDTDAPDAAWSSWSRFFPWEAWRKARPAAVDEVIAPALIAWAGASGERRNRVRLLFALDGSPWAEERVLERSVVVTRTVETKPVPEAPKPQPNHGKALMSPEVSRQIWARVSAEMSSVLARSAKRQTRGSVGR